MAESGQETSMPACGCVQCIQNWTTQSPALRENTVPTIQRSASYQMNTYTSSDVLTSAGSPNHVYNEYPSESFQTQMSSYVLPSYETPIFRSTYGEMYNGTYSRPSPAIVPAEIRSYTPTSNTTWASQDTFEDLHSQTTPDTVALPDPNNWLYRINNFIPSETRTLTSAPQRIHSTMSLNDLPVIPQTLDVISSVSTFPTQPSSTPSSNNPPYLMSSTAPNTPQLSLSPNNPPYLMSSTAPSTPQLSLNIPSATVQESSIDSSDQYTLEFNNNANEPMASSMDYTEGNSESETEIDRNLPEEVSMPEEEIIDRPKQLCPHNDTDECDDDCPFLHGRLCHLCHTHRLNPYNPELHADCSAGHPGVILGSSWGPSFNVFMFLFDSVQQVIWGSSWGLSFNVFLFLFDSVQQSLSCLPNSFQLCNRQQILDHMSTIKKEDYGVVESGLRGNVILRLSNDASNETWAAPDTTECIYNIQFVSLASPDITYQDQSQSGSVPPTAAPSRDIEENTERWMNYRGGMPRNAQETK
ncbi:mucin-2-like [Biomphalaria glabrata]|uniref:Mucin-2-like n=1 Tax=Biomphalaria glabrata TaxID=6526 RepID=A0A9W3A584_BIOGL|nr:mucin-2-like [Biomphalaria glabrata]